MIEIRPFQNKDFNVLLDLANLAGPFAEKDNREWLEYRKAFDESKRLRRHFLAVANNTPAGYGCLEQQGDDPHWLRIFVVCSPENLKSDIGDRIYLHLIQTAIDLGATNLWAREYQSDEPIYNFFASRGFIETERFTIPDQPPMVVFKLDLANSPPEK